MFKIRQQDFGLFRGKLSLCNSLILRREVPITIRQRLKEIMNGRRMSDEDFLLLYEQGELLEIGQAANRKREEIFGNNQATFVIDRNIN